MILNNENEELNLVMKFKVENFDYVIYATSSMMKCFGCGKEGHTIRACPDKEIQSAAQDNVANEGTSAGRDRARNPKPAAENHGSEVVEMMDLNTMVNDEVNTVVNVDVNTVVNDDANNVVKAVVNIVSNGEGKDESVGLEENNVAAVVAEAGGGDDLDVAEDEPFFKTPAIKTKTSKRGKAKKEKKIVDHNGLNVKEVEVDSDTICLDESAPGSESESSDASVAVRTSGRTAYTLEKIKTFLQNTKGVSFFPRQAKVIGLRKNIDEGYRGGWIYRSIHFQIVFFLVFLLFVCCPVQTLFSTIMSRIKVGILNLNGGRDVHKRAILFQLIKQNKKSML